MRIRKSSNFKIYGMLIFLIILPYAGMYGVKLWYDNKIQTVKNARFVLVDKNSMKLCLYDYNGNELQQFGIACGKNFGNKIKAGDMRTPEGVFHIVSIENSSDWKHDFGDGKGEIAGAYGPHFIRLQVPGHKGIGIHGTHNPESIGDRQTEGCIRLKNEDLEKLVPYLQIGMTVVITPSQGDVDSTTPNGNKLGNE